MNFYKVQKKIKKILNIKNKIVAFSKKKELKQNYQIIKKRRNNNNHINNVPLANI